MAIGKSFLVFGFWIFILLWPTSSKAGSAADILKLDSLEQKLESADSTEGLQILKQLSELSVQFAPGLTKYYLKKQLLYADALAIPEEQALARMHLAAFAGKTISQDTIVRLLEEALKYQKHAFSHLRHESANVSTSNGETKDHPFSWRSAFLWRMLLVFSFLLLPLGLVWMLYSSHKLKERYQKAQDQFGDFQANIFRQKQQLEAIIQERTSLLEEQLRETRAKDVELKKTLKRLKDASYLKNAFLSNMSHEIRTPLNGIIGFASLLETELAVMENQDLYSYASGIQQSGDRLLNLINNIIEISRIQANEIEVDLHPCDPAVIINNVCEPLVFTANEKSLKFKTKTQNLPHVIADNAKLMRVLHIILDNAVKYTNDGFVTLTTQTDFVNKELLIRVKDTGIGMDKSYMNFLFEAFRQENSGYSRPFQGAGLGLPLAKKLLDLMHGRILIQSEKNQGTTVDIFLPLAPDADQETTVEMPLKPIANAPEIGKLDIFIVEDDRMNRMVLQKILAKSGNITMAVDGNETMKIIGERYKKEHVFQVMLFDINLPAPWDGVKLMQQIRIDFPEYKFVPFIAQTAYAMAGDKERFLDAGFDDYIAKPVNKNELLTKIENQLNLKLAKPSNANILPDNI